VARFSAQKIFLQKGLTSPNTCGILATLQGDRQSKQQSKESCKARIPWEKSRARRKVTSSKGKTCEVLIEKKKLIGKMRLGHELKSSFKSRISGFEQFQRMKGRFAQNVANAANYGVARISAFFR